MLLTTSIHYLSVHMHLRLVGLRRQSIFTGPPSVFLGRTKALLMAFSGRSLDTPSHAEHILATDDLVDMREFGFFFSSPYLLPRLWSNRPLSSAYLRNGMHLCVGLRCMGPRPYVQCGSSREDYRENQAARPSFPLFFFYPSGSPVPPLYIPPFPKGRWEISIDAFVGSGGRMGKEWVLPTVPLNDLPLGPCITAR